MQAPGSRFVGRGAGEESRVAGKFDIEVTKRRRQSVAGRLAHRFLACPVAQETLPPSRCVEVGDRRLLAPGQEFGRQTIGTDVAVLVLEVDADSRPFRQISSDRHERLVARVRYVEVDAPGRIAEFGAAARAVSKRYRVRWDAQFASEKEA